MGTLITSEGCPMKAHKINRNQPCPCGSGLKAKNCCGNETRYFYNKPKPAPDHRAKTYKTELKAE